MTAILVLFIANFDQVHLIILMSHDLFKVSIKSISALTGGFGDRYLATGYS